MPREVPKLVKRNGVYNVVWTDPAVRDAAGKIVQPARTQRHGLRTREPVEAQNRYAAFLVQGKALVAGVGGPDRLNVARGLDDYYREHAAKTADPVRAENAIRHLKAHFGDMPFADIDIPACRGYAEARRSGAIAHKEGRGRRVDGASVSTVRRELVVLQAAAHHALRWKRIPATEMPTFELPAEPRDGSEAKWLTAAEVDRLFDLSTGPLHHFVKLAYWWGARRGWVERLHVSQVNLETGRVNPYKPGEVVTNKRRGIMPIFPEIRGDLEKLVAGATGGFLFGSSHADFYRPFTALCGELQFGDRSHPHVLRHSRATHMLMAGESIYKVARLLGDSVPTVERVYGHYSQEFLTESSRARDTFDPGAGR